MLRPAALVLRFPSPRAATNAGKNCGHSAANPQPRASWNGSQARGTRPLRHTPETGAADAREENRNRMAECGQAGGPATATATPGNRRQSKQSARSNPRPIAPGAVRFPVLSVPASSLPAHTSFARIMVLSRTLLIVSHARRLLQARVIRPNHSSPLLQATERSVMRRWH
ncbi:hypothetical protein PLICRDRAFT_30690 [Plicaturopsis crispa FD-325 SS-3]|nr:hypothetical protein PLICRDRAFT_30690 [Plicaturopsis crispa FD-325 SS-3]